MVLFLPIQKYLSFPHFIAYTMPHKAAMMRSTIHKLVLSPFGFYIWSVMTVETAPTKAANA